MGSSSDDINEASSSNNQQSSSNLTIEEGIDEETPTTGGDQEAKANEEAKPLLSNAQEKQNYDATNEDTNETSNKGGGDEDKSRQEEESKSGEEQQQGEESEEQSQDEASTHSNNENTSNTTSHNKDEEGQGEKIKDRLFRLLNGSSTRDIHISKESTRLAKFIVKSHQNVVNALLFKNKKNHNSFQTKSDMTKYIFVDFGSWVYNGSDKLWVSILKEIWKQVEGLYGSNKVRFYRASVDLEGRKRGESNGSGNNIGLIDSEEVDKARKDALKSFNMESILSTIFAAATTVTGVWLKFIHEKNQNDDSGDRTKVYQISAITTLVIGLLPITKQIYIFLRYVLPMLLKSRASVIRDKASSNRDQYFDNTGFKGFVKNEVEYILDFLRYTPFIDEENECKRPARLCIFVDDLDRCDGKTVMDVLEAVILLLVDAPVTFWLALDTRLVVASIEEAKEGLLEKAGVSGYEAGFLQTENARIPRILRI